MSLAGVLVMAAVVLILPGAWLVAVFLAARRPASGPVHPGSQGAPLAPGQQAGPRGADEATAQRPDTTAMQADQAPAQPGKAGSPLAGTARGA
jgi:hypothetical protein